MMIDENWREVPKAIYILLQVYFVKSIDFVIRL